MGAYFDKYTLKYNIKSSNFGSRRLVTKSPYYYENNLKKGEATSESFHGMGNFHETCNFMLLGLHINLCDASTQICLLRIE